VGKVFTKAELRALGDFCKRHDLLLLSDEIYHDLILDETKTPHVPIAALGDAELMKRTIILHASSKTYNVPGLSCAYAVIPDEELRLRFKKAARCVGRGEEKKEEERRGGRCAVFFGGGGGVPLLGELRRWGFSRGVREVHCHRPMS
jgi:hypothetical protein